MKHHKRRYRGENSIVDDIAARFDKNLMYGEPSYFIDGQETTKENFVKWLRSTGRTEKEIKDYFRKVNAAQKDSMNYG